MRKTLTFLFYLLAGIIFGSLIAGVCAKIPGLTWLAYSNSIGLSVNNPAVLDLIIIKVSLGFEMRVCVAQIFTIIIAMFMYHRMR